MPKPMGRTKRASNFLAMAGHPRNRPRSTSPLLAAHGQDTDRMECANQQVPHFVYAHEVPFTW